MTKLFKYWLLRIAGLLFPDDFFGHVAESEASQTHKSRYWGVEFETRYLGNYHSEKGGGYGAGAIQITGKPGKDFRITECVELGVFDKRSQALRAIASYYGATITYEIELASESGPSWGVFEIKI